MTLPRSIGCYFYKRTALLIPMIFGIFFLPIAYHAVSFPKIIYFYENGGYAETKPRELPPCLSPENMTWLGNVPVSLHLTKEEAIRNNSNVENGGLWKPSDCLARKKVAILVPYRDRETHLWTFLHHMHHFLQKQYLEYRIYIIEQSETSAKFNRAKLFNIGFLEASKDNNWDAFIFHDVDLLPTDTRNMYYCSTNPRHMSVAIDKFNFKLLYEGQFGGVSCMTNSSFYLVNGFSNAYFGWGAEDDDMASRITFKGLRRARYPPYVARYIMITHKSLGSANPKSRHLLNYSKELMEYDGLRTTEYNVTNIEKHPLFTKVTVDFKNDGLEYLELIREKKLKRLNWAPNHGSKITYEKMKW